MTRETVATVLRAGVRRLKEAGVPEPARDARLLMAEALGIDAGRLTLMEPEMLQNEPAARFETFVERRAAHCPVSHILGRRWFWGREFEVGADVLDPRPETELLVELALAGRRPGRVLDLGTGSGILLISLLSEWPEATGLGVDRSHDALRVARRNAVRHGVDNQAELRSGDWCDGVEGGFDLVVCNPPYIPRAEIATLDRSVRDWEPHMALSEGPTGLESYVRIAAGLRDVLVPGGRALFEIGADQGESVPELFRRAGFENVRMHRDLAGKARSVDISI
ncbi:peptide chain release factor N(5)-glutamine methyltransferase [Amaricoccus macauensis]|uniref:peptide chain release factor N(5)-glutamine methyltransferase n=1 Tax=Amaricoccus macauensis TaxID=57001 RepID=UPI003C7DE7C0